MAPAHAAAAEDCRRLPNVLSATFDGSILHLRVPLVICAAPQALGGSTTAHQNEPLQWVPRQGAPKGGVACENACDLRGRGQTSPAVPPPLPPLRRRSPPPPPLLLHRTTCRREPSSPMGCSASHGSAGLSCWVALPACRPSAADVSRQPLHGTSCMLPCLLAPPRLHAISPCAYNRIMQCRDSAPRSLPPPVFRQQPLLHTSLQPCRQHPCLPTTHADFGRTVKIGNNEFEFEDCDTTNTTAFIWW